MSLKQNQTRWLCTSPGVIENLLDGSTQNFTYIPVPLHTYWGAYVQRNSGETYDQANTRFDTACGARTEILREYDQNNPSGGNGAAEDLAFIQQCTTDYAGTTIFNGSFRLTPASVVAGTYDAQITNLFTTMLSRGIKFYWTYCHEFDGPVYGIHGGQITLTGWAAAQQHIYTLSRSLSTTMLQSVVTFTSQSFNGAAATINPSNQLARCNSYYPYFEGYCDGIGVDPYTSTPGQTVEQLVSPLYSTVSALNGPFFCVPEIGTKSFTQAQNTPFYASMNWLDQLAVFVCIFNDNSSPYTGIDTNSTAALAYGKLMSHTA